MASPSASPPPKPRHRRPSCACRRLLEGRLVPAVGLSCGEAVEVQMLSAAARLQASQQNTFSTVQQSLNPFARSEKTLQTGFVV